MNRANDDVGHHVDEPGVVIDRFGSDHRQPEALAYGRRLLVEVDNTSMWSHTNPIGHKIAARSPCSARR